MPLAPVIASPGRGPYFGPMLAAILRLLTMAALAMMPIGMASAGAGPVHHAPSAASAGHCDDQDGQPAEERRDGLPGCTAGCSMFMADLASADAPLAVLGQLTPLPPARRWLSLPPETATPPPKPA